MVEHFVRPPHWEWYILAYFFLGGLTGGSYVLATMLRLWGSSRDEAVARVGFLIAFPLLLVCPILLSLDLGQPARFWHMLINTTPGRTGVIFKYWSPMSVGSWILLIYGLFTFVLFLEVLALDGRIRGGLGQALTGALSGGGGRVFNVVGALLGAYIASYTGVLLSVSNQPIWSDTWALGGRFSGGSAGTGGTPTRPKGVSTRPSATSPCSSWPSSSCSSQTSPVPGSRAAPSRAPGRSCGPSWS